MKIGFTYDLRSDWISAERDPSDANAEFDKPETIETISQALASWGHEVCHIGNLAGLLDQLDTLDVDIVFNICEGLSGRNRESQVPVLLEARNIPYIGSDGLTMALTLDKIMAKKCFRADGIPTPRFFVARDSSSLKSRCPLDFPLIVKASAEGTSKGLTEASRVEDMPALIRQVDHITRTYRQPALIEEFIAGQEFTVAVIGNDPPQAMPVVQISIDQREDLGDRFFTYEMVVNEDIVTYVCPARISTELKQTLQEWAVRTYTSVGCLDFGRVDFRVDREGQPYVLEINPLPALGKNDIFNIFPFTMGLTYQDIIQCILEHGLKRYGMIDQLADKFQAALIP